MKTVGEWCRWAFLKFQLGLSFLVAAAFALWVEWFGGARVVDAALLGNRALVYATLASIAGSLLGFTITAISIALVLSGFDRLLQLRASKHYKELWDIFTVAIRALGFATVIAALALVMDRDNAVFRPILYVCVFAVVLASLQLARCIWILEKLVGIIAAPSKARPGADYDLPQETHRSSPPIGGDK